MKKILIITNHYLNRRAGGTMASLSFINAFASIFADCTLIFPFNDYNFQHLIKPSIKTIPCKDNRFKLQKGAEIYFGKLHRFEKTVKAAFSTDKPDVVVFDTSIVSFRLIKLAKKLGIYVITIHHNVERDYLKDNPRPLFYRYAYNYFMEKAEKEAVEKSDLNLTLTDSDGIRLASLYRSHLKIYNIGVFETFQTHSLALLVKSKSNDMHLKFVITGNLAFPQSDLSIRQFVTKYWPIVRSQISGSELVITGGDPSPHLNRLCRKNIDIHLIPNPEDISSIISGCDFYICPVDRGSGFKYRIMDGLRLGMPVISHKISARGYEAFSKNRTVLIYDSEASFRDAVIQIRENVFDRNQIKIMYEEFFSFNGGINRLNSILEKLNIL